MEHRRTTRIGARLLAYGRAPDDGSALGIGTRKLRHGTDVRQPGINRADGAAVTHGDAGVRWDADGAARVAAGWRNLHQAQ